MRGREGRARTAYVNPTTFAPLNTNACAPTISTHTKASKRRAHEDDYRDERDVELEDPDEEQDDPSDGVSVQGRPEESRVDGVDRL